MLAELRNEDLSPKNYYHLFTAVFDEMLLVEDFFKEEINRGRKAHDVYESVQQAKYLIPRLYLMIIAGGLTMERDHSTIEEITTDLLGMIKGVQNPTRGLFTRYFLLERLKDKLPDKDNEEEGIKFDDTLKFILQNLEEMNRLWIRISSDVEGSEKLARDKERVDLKILVGESINRLASLDSLTIEIYEKEVLPNLIQIILESNDKLSQQYIMECIIHAFSDTYNIKCIELILNTFSRLLPEVDIKELFISLSEKLSKFISIHTGEDATEEDKQLVSSAIGVYPILVQYFDRLQKETFMQAIDMDVCKLLDLNADSYYPQLPVCLFFNKQPYGKYSIFTGKRSAIDFWTVTSKTLNIIELKKGDNTKIGVLSELFFYTCFTRDVFKSTEGIQDALNASVALTIFVKGTAGKPSKDYPNPSNFYSFVKWETVEELGLLDLISYE
jgi:hypothetical protein